MDEKPVTLPIATPLLSAINEIVKHEVVLVSDDHNRIVGLVTTTDLSEQLKELSEAFLLLGDVEHHLRRLIQRGRFGVDELRGMAAPESTRRIDGVDDLSFGEYVRLLDEPKNWARLRLNLDRVEFIKRLNALRQTRNAVMHFRSGSLKDHERDDLRDTVEALRHLLKNPRRKSH